MKTLVWVEHDGKAVKDATLAVVTAASKLGEVHLLVAGSGVDAVAKEAAQIAGVGKVHVADNAAFDAMLRARGFAGLRLQSEVLADEDHLSVAPRGFTRGLLHTLAAAPRGD